MPWIHRCLTSLRESSQPTDVFIVDNCSSDGTREYIPSHFPEALWFPQERNLGFGQGNNIGLRYAIDNGYDYVLLLNQDAYLGVDALEKMLAVSDGKSLLSPLHLNGNGNSLDPMFRVSMRNSIEENSYLDDLVLRGRENVKTSYTATEICAACWFMPVSLLNEVGGFNPLFFHYSEDNNYYQRMVYHGIKTILVPSASVCHDREGGHGNVSAYNHKRLHRDFLVILDNINIGVFKIFQKLTVLLFICLLKDMPSGRYKFGGWSREMLWMIFNIGKIAKSRRTEKQKGASWL